MRGSLRDRPTNGELRSLTMGQNVQQKLREGDWVILATDGLYDNMPDKDIVGFAAKADSPMGLADTLGETAMANSLDDGYVSPFMTAATKAGVKWKGGKVDDVTIVAIKIRDDESIKPLTLLSTLPEAPVEEKAAPA